MKKKLLFAFMAITLGGMAQTDPNYISFENDLTSGPSYLGPNGTCTPATYIEGDPIDNQFFDCAYGVTFHEGSLGGNPPIYAHVGPGTVNGFHNGNTSSTYTSPLYGCSTTHMYGKPEDDLPGSVTIPGFIWDDLGCYFLTTKQARASIFVQFGSDGCFQSSGTTLDVDGQEAWHIKAYSSTGALLDEMALVSPACTGCTPPSGVTIVNAPAGDGKSSAWSVSSTTDAINYIEFDYIGTSNAGFAFDNFYVCGLNTIPLNAGCCEDSVNLIDNGDFTNVAAVNSNYTYETTIANESVNPGEYSIVNTAQATTISPQWGINDHSTCSANSGNFMVVNGRTMGSGSEAVYTVSNIAIEEDAEYIFCMYYQQLDQCTFDVFDEGNITLQFNGGTATSTTGCTTQNECGWTKLSWSIVPNSGVSSLDITVSLNEAGVGDGNDVAFDDFSLQRKGEIDISLAKFTTSDFYPNPSLTTYEKTATAIISSLPADHTATWIVDEIDCGTVNNPNPTVLSTWSVPSWDEYNTDFPGVGSGVPGVFDEEKCYRITRTISNCCSVDQSFSVIFQNNSHDPPMDEGEGDNDRNGNMGSDNDGESWFNVPFTSVEQKSSSSEFFIFPNPGDGILTIQSNKSLKGSQLIVLDMKGDELQELQIVEDGNTAKIELAELINGLYTIKLIEADGIISYQKYIKQ